MGSSDSDGPAPVIGVVSYVESATFGVWETDAALIPRSYVDAVVRAGGIPVLLPPVGGGQREIVARIDGVVLSGGADIDPARYGAERAERTKVVRPERDAYEFALLAEATAVGLPVFAVCRGVQLLNVALGGTLMQHLPDAIGTSAHLPTPGVYGSRRVTTLSGSKIDDIVGADAQVHCHHHQAIDRLADGLHATAWAEDGTIEAAEADGDAFLLGVQWHPEESIDDRLFAELIAYARRYRTENS
ncbi:gamma-glutamyl-gamma-aminobutyrate hydrolase family protein [Antrihabitans cavernicola]|uniref:gamma-glutamyl-gamma-aminobutyrate hydrolase family protein n=1 Tax=Antrihabitans cavernicola TaxID=2495913 RepID=UPI001F2BC6EE|nr:gamma-glutamyl-gamma-aminobutyrate hydrolase family protein [Spelaeibacter cavernicola]